MQSPKFLARALTAIFTAAAAPAATAAPAASLLDDKVAQIEYIKSLEPGMKNTYAGALAYNAVKLPNPKSVATVVNGFFSFAKTDLTPQMQEAAWKKAAHDVAHYAVRSPAGFRALECKLEAAPKDIVSAYVYDKSIDNLKGGKNTPYALLWQMNTDYSAAFLIAQTAQNSVDYKITPAAATQIKNCMAQ
ncbi:MAG: hypothetical protein KDJ49_08995 [Alphaproteobacteria bacterium]|nr:hypothetical protein [Alphaproteobacteria bacterium]USO07763.1 MAG: hypothetical protein H6866_00570 [Rhodospirillales bacterium]